MEVNSMTSTIRVSLVVVLLILCISGCSGHGNPTEPVISDENGITETAMTSEAASNTHYCLLYDLIYFDVSNPDDIRYEIEPLREGSIHLNILKLLEVMPCTDCFKIVGLSIPEPGALQVNIEIAHPFKGDMADDDFTIFDVRGIMMFDGSASFPVSGLTYSDHSLGDGTLINTDGFTSLYNGNTLGAAGDFLSYFPGKLSTIQVPNADLNGYKRHITGDFMFENYRNTFYIGHSSTVTYELALPASQFVLGYAVDASWAPPFTEPDMDPQGAFGPEANSLVPWKIEVSGSFNEFLTPSGGQTTLTIDVYDWQGKESYTDPVIECPEIFDGTLTATWIENVYDNYDRFEVTVFNVKSAPIGEYNCLISIEDIDNDPVGKPWLDLTAYEIYPLNVYPFDPVDVTPPWFNFYVNDISLVGNYVYTADNNDLNILDISNPPNPQWTTSIETPNGSGIVETEGSYACILEDYNTELKIFDINSPENPQLLHNVPIEFYFQDIALLNGYGYLIMSDILHIIDLSMGQIIHTVEKPISISEWSPIGVSENCACILEGWLGNELSIIDISDPETAYFVKSVGTSISDLSRLVISNGFAYALERSYGRLAIFDIDPMVDAYEVSTMVTPGKPSDIAVVGNLAYIIDNEENEVNLLVVNVGNPASPTIADSIDLPEYTRGSKIRISGNYAYLASGSAGLMVCDLSQPTLVQPVGGFGVITEPKNIEISNGYAYVATNDSGFKIIDIGSPEYAKVISWLYFDEAVYDMSVSGGLACLTERENQRFHLVNIETPEAPSIINTLDLSGNAEDAIIDGDKVYITSKIPQDYGLIEVFNINPPESAYSLGSLQISYLTTAMAVTNGYAFTSNASSDMHIYDIDPIVSAFEVEWLHDVGIAYDFAFNDGFAFYPNKHDFKVFDIDPIDSIHRILRIDPPDPWTTRNRIAISDGYAYTTDQGDGFLIFDIDPPKFTNLVCSFEIENGASDISVSGNYAYTVYEESEFKIIKLW